MESDRYQHEHASRGIAHAIYDVRGGGLVSKAQNVVVKHPTMFLILLAVVIILLLYVTVKYRGLLGFGPYTTQSPSSKKEEDDDPETSRLLDKLNE